MMDAVITWVDGNDPAFRQKMAPYLTSLGETSLSDVGGRARLISCREIAAAVGSLLRFAPFVGRIFIVTDGQDPDLGAFLEKNFPGNKVPVVIVDHKVLFRDYENYLPVFNSMSIETMLWRIPDLSDVFLYLNDDYFLAAPLAPGDVYEDGKYVCYGSEMSVAWADFLKRFHRRRNGHRRISYKDTLANGSKVIGDRKFFLLGHTPECMDKRVFEAYFNANPDVMVFNIAHRFREEGQFNVQNMFYRLCLAEGKTALRPTRDVAVIFRPLQRKRNYMKRKLALADRMPHLKFGCMNSLQDATPEDARLYWQWISQRLQLDFSMLFDKV